MIIETGRRGTGVLTGQRVQERPRRWCAAQQGVRRRKRQEQRAAGRDHGKVRDQLFAAPQFQQWIYAAPDVSHFVLEETTIEWKQPGEHVA